MAQNIFRSMSIDKKLSHSGIPFSSCWRIFVKLKYSLTISKQSIYKFLRFSCCVFAVISILLLLLIMNEENDMMDNRNLAYTFGQHKNRNNFERQPHVYQVIESWMYQKSENFSSLPILTSFKKEKYTKNEVFPWKEIPVHNINNILDSLDKAEHKGNISDFGEYGKVVNLPQHLEKKSRARISLHQLDVVASDLMSLNRKLNDMRNSRCLSKRYSSRLPSASIIVIFHNEARSSLLRTIHSVVNRSPHELLAEIILVDDASDNEELLSSLDKYFLDFPIPVQIIRLKEREGLIRARIKGAEKSIGQVLIFLDAHMEATAGWLVPLLSEISRDRTRVVLPVIDEINSKTFEYSRAENDRMRGGLNWKLRHIWLEPDKRGGVLSGNDNDGIDPFPSPTMIGCAFAIDREFFFLSGTYDDKMLIWGGENVEMSLRIWRCGGSLMVLPCSHVGHVYRNVTPHSIPGSVQEKLNRVTINTARFAEVWLDRYKEFYYNVNPDAQNLEIGDISARISLIEDLKCRSFQWFIDNVYPDASFPNRHQYFGQIRPFGSDLCLESPGEYGGMAMMKLCHGLGSMQKILYTEAMELRNGVNCMEAFFNNKTKRLEVGFFPCNFKDEQKWDFKREENGSSNGGQIIDRKNGKCLMFAKENVDNAQSDIRKKKEKMIAFLSKIVKETVMKAEVPYVSDCELIQNTAGSTINYKLQKWQMKNI